MRAIRVIVPAVTPIGKKFRKLRQDPGLFLHDLVAANSVTPNWLVRRLQGHSANLLVRWAKQQSTVAPLVPRIRKRIGSVSSAGVATALDAAIESLLMDCDREPAVRLAVAGAQALAKEDLEVASQFAAELELDDHRVGEAIVSEAIAQGRLEVGEPFVPRLDSDSQVLRDFHVARLAASEGDQMSLAIAAGRDSIRAYMTELLEREPVEFASCVFLFSRLYAHFAETKKFPELVTEVGEKLLSIQASERNTIRVADTYLHRGSIGDANRIVDTYFIPDSPRHAKKQRHLRAFTKLLADGFDYTVEATEPNYRPFPGRVLTTLHNSLPFDSGGYATRTHGLATGIAQNDWYISGVTRLGYPNDRAPHADKKAPPESHVDGIRYLRMKGKGLGKKPLYDYLASYAEALYQLALVEEPEVIHAHANAMNGVVANKVARALGIKCIYEVRGLWEVTRISRQPEFADTEYFRLLQSLEVQAAREADAVVCITEALKDEMVRRGVDAAKITIVPNAVDVGRFVPRPRNEELAAQLSLTGKRVIGYIGSIVDYEGLDDLMRAIRIIRDRGREDIGVLIVGDGAVLDDLKCQTTALNLDDVVTFTGRVPHSEIEDFYSVVDVAPFPRKSLPVTEMVSPLKPFEAMAMAKVVVASDVAALREIVVPDVNGFLFEKDNIKSLADTLEAALDEVGKLRLTPREWVIENRSWEMISARAASLYGSLTQRETPNPNRGLKWVSMAPEVIAVLEAFRERFGEDQKHHLRRDDFARFSVVLEHVRHQTSILDVGVGTGQFLNICAEHGTFERLRGVDIKPHGSFIMLRDGSFEMDYVSIEKLPYNDGEFDVVTCLEVIEHLPEEIFLAGIVELRRVCAKQLIISVPFRERVLARDHKRRFYLDDLERLFPSGDISFLRKINKIEGRESCWAVVIENQ